MTTDGSFEKKPSVRRAPVVGVTSHRLCRSPSVRRPLDLVGSFQHFLPRGTLPVHSHSEVSFHVAQRQAPLPSRPSTRNNNNNNRYRRIVVVVNNMMASARASIFLQLTMATLSLAASSAFRPMSAIASCAFRFHPWISSPRWNSSSSSNHVKSKSSAAYGRTTLRHLRRDTESWRMSLSSEESNMLPSSSDSSTSSTTFLNLEQYRNPNNLDDQVFSAISADGGLKVTVATIRNLLNEMMIQHSMNPLPGGECIF